MKIFSQNLTNYNVTLPEDAVYRINLAWVNSLDELKQLLEKHRLHDIFLDLPIGRTKPPNNTYTIEDLMPILKDNSNVKYFAISNVASSNDLKDIMQIIPNNISIVPKIESPEGVNNILEIVNFLQGPEKVIMLDHDDLYSALTKKGEDPSQFKNYVNDLIKFCNENNVILLRTIGVIFSNEETRVTQYVG